jgi:hypothetical protein
MTTDTQTPESGTTSQEMVRVEEAAIEDLDQFLAEESGTKTGSPAKPEEEHDEEEEHAETASVSDGEDDSEAEEQAEEPPKPQTEDKKQDVSRAEFEAQQKRLEGLELVVKRRTSQLADVKKSLSELIAAKREGLEERLAADPVQGHEDLAEIREATAAIKQIDEQTADLNASHQNQVVVLQHVDFSETPIDAIAQCFMDDGIAPEIVQQFKQNPFRGFPATTVIQAAKRAKAEKYVGLLVTALKAERAKTAKLSGKSSDVMKRIDEAARRLPDVTAHSGGAAAEEEIPDDLAVEQMSDKQLEALERKLAKGKRR